MPRKKTTAKKSTAKKSQPRKKARLGRGLGALLGEVQPAAAALPGEEQLREVGVEQLQRGKYQPRGVMQTAALDELADSIKAKGIIQPLVVRAAGGDKFEIIAGERRWRAAQRAGLKRVPVVIRQADDQSAMAVALIENMQREDLNAIEEAVGLRRLLDEFEMTHAAAAEAVGKSRATVTNLLRLLNLAKEVQQAVQAGELDMGHARELLRLPSTQQAAAARQIINAQMSVRQTEALVKKLLAGGGTTAKKVDPDVLNLQEKLSARLGAEVKIQHAGGGGKLIIRYHSLDELDGIIKRIK